MYHGLQIVLLCSTLVLSKLDYSCQITPNLPLVPYVNLMHFTIKACIQHWAHFDPPLLKVCIQNLVFHP